MQNDNPNLENQEAEKAKSTSGFTFRQRLLPTLLLALTLGLTLCLIGPFDIFLNNIDEFLFRGTDFALWVILFGVGLTGAVCAILLPLRGKAFDVTYAVFFSLTLMFFMQGNYLNFGLNSLEGDGVGEVANRLPMTVINAAVWIVVVAGCILTVLFLKKQYREWIRTVGIIAMVTIIGMQLIPLAVGVLTMEEPDIEETKEIDSVLTYENFNAVGTDRNVFYFVVDRFDYSFYEDYALKEAPEIFEFLDDGFTYYNDMVSLYPRTYPAVPYMLSGREHDFDDYRVDYLNEAYEKSDFLNLLSSEGYDVNIYTDGLYGYHTAEPMKAYVSNSSEKMGTYQVVRKLNLSWDMVRLSLYRYFPFCLKSTVGAISTPDFERYIEYTTVYPKYTSDMKDAYEYLQNNPIAATDTEKNFSFIHLAGCHIPNQYNENFHPAIGSDRQSPTVSLKQSFKIINQYLAKLKELGLYRDATIIITGDHGSLRGSDAKLLNDPDKSGPFLTALFIKPAGSEGTPLQISTAPIAQADILPSILQSEGVTSDIDFGRSVFEIDAGESRERRCVFHSYQSGKYEEVIFKIVGSGRSLDNWNIESRGKYIGDIYE